MPTTLRSMHFSTSRPCAQRNPPMRKAHPLDDKFSTNTHNYYANAYFYYKNHENIEVNYVYPE
jgi:hypothetical protein